MSDIPATASSGLDEAAAHRHALVDDVQIEPHGVSGLEGKPAGDIRRVCESTFDGAFWLPGTAQPDQHAGFIADVSIAQAGDYRIDIQTSATFRLRLDGDTIAHGPLRYSPSLPEYHHQTVTLSVGPHRFSVHALAELLTTRMASAITPFVWVRLTAPNGDIVALDWRGRHLDEYTATGLRVSPLLGWVEWQGRPFASEWWLESSSEAWMAPEPVDLSDELGLTTASDVSLPQWTTHSLEASATGVYRDTYVGYEFDDIGTQFLLADDAPPADDDLDGRWFRFDLGRVRVGSVRLVLASSEPAEVTVAFAERLTPDGRPSPVIALSAGSTRMLQHFAIGSGTSTIEPLQSLGGRYLEVRVRGPLDVELLTAEFVERDMLGEPTGRFESDDPVLNAVWKTGLDTLRATAEDSLIDSVRERGEWVGDVVTSALNLLTTGWGDVRLVQRALLHSAAGARADGLVAGCGPGEVLYLGTYAAQWVTACMNVARAEGTTDILAELEESARANVKALVSSVNDDGSHSLPWSFVDWGYGVPRHQPNLAVIAHVHQAVRTWRLWLALLGKAEEADSYAVEEERLEGILTQWMPDPANRYHSWTLGAHAGVVDKLQASDCILEHVERGFPFDRSAQRLRDPKQVRPGAVTPYFTNYSFPILLDSGHGAKVAELWRSGWGWMLDRGATTWWEVFDERWSQCHYWGGAPTWQLSRFGLGLHAELDGSGTVVELRVNDLGLDRLSGLIHLPGGRTADVSWARAAPDELAYTVTFSHAVRLMVRSVEREVPAGTHSFVLERVGDGANYV